MYNEISGNRRIAKNTIILNIRLVITLCIALYSSRLVLQVLGVEDYGLYNLVGGFVGLLSIITSSITGSITRFLTLELGKGDMKTLNRTFCSVINVLIVMAVIVAFIAAIVGPWFINNYLTIPDNKVSAALIVFVCSAVVFILNLLSVPYTALVTAHEKMNFFAVMSIYDSVSKLVIIIFLQYYGSEKLVMYAIFLAIAALLNRIIYNIYCNRYFIESKFYFTYETKTMKQVLSFSVWMGIGSAAGILKDQGGNILINIFFGLILNASMGIATQVKGLVTQFANSIGVAISPQIIKSFASGDTNRSIDLTFWYVKCTGIFMLLIVIPILSETSYLLNIWLTNVPDYADVFVKLIICNTFFNTLNMGFGPIYLANGRIRNYQIFSTVVMLSYIPVSYILLRTIGHPTICLIVGLCIEILFLFTNYYCLKIQLRFPISIFFTKVIIKILFIAAISLMVTMLIRYFIQEECFARFIMNSIFSLLCTMSLAFSFLINEEERTKITKMIKNRISSWT